MSYDILIKTSTGNDQIERSPDHWWVTTLNSTFTNSVAFIERSPDHWWVTTTTVLAVVVTLGIERSPDHWWVTTFKLSDITLQRIERSPDHWWVTTESKFTEADCIPDWKVTRSLVSYDWWEWSFNWQICDWKVTRSLMSYTFRLMRFCTI